MDQESSYCDEQTRKHGSRYNVQTQQEGLTQEKYIALDNTLRLSSLDIGRKPTRSFCRLTGTDIKSW